MTPEETAANRAGMNLTEDFAPAGSPGKGGPEFLVVGKLRRPHGIRGEISMEIFTDFPERLRSGITVYVGEEHIPHQIRSRRSIHNGLLIAFQDIDTPEAAVALRNTFVYVRADDRPSLPEGEYYHHEIIGLQVVSDEGQALGELVEILSYPANDVYVVRPPAGPELLIPALQSVIVNVDLAAGQMQVHLLPGLLPE
jgi:16S rRNA processing protein RimM